MTPAQQHLDWLARLSTDDDPPVTPETAARAVKLWEAIRSASGGRMPVPAACTGPDGEMFHSWDWGRHHLEVEIIPSKPVQWFYRDRETEEFTGADQADGQPIPAVIVALVECFYPATEVRS